MSTARTILVADDSLTIRKLVEAILREEGFQVTAVTTGADCLKQAAALKPSLILLDYILPDMQGTEICRSLINSPETWEIPVLMMSSNGNAIRQLYQDLNNVADYLTKPFAPSVLKAVVGHLLQKDKSDGETASSTTAAPAGPEMPKDFADKVTRLLGLMEGQPAAVPAVAGANEATPSAPAAATSDTSLVPRKKARRPRKAVASAPASDAVLRKVRLALQKQLRPRLALIPDWEADRGAQSAESFFLSRVLSKEVLSALCADMLRIAGLPTDSAGALRCPVSLLPLDSLLQHLQATRATGELRIETEEEIVLACLEQGQVVLLTSNNPRNYCAGAAFDFQAVPHTVISEAVSQQEEQSLPFFTSLHEAGHLPSATVLEDLLRTQGGKCLSRAYKSSQSVVSFVPLAKLSPLARAGKLDFSLSQLLLACYRTVDDWFALEKVVPDMDDTLVPALELGAQPPELQLEADEVLLLEAVQPGRTIPELAEILQKKPFEVCLVLFRFIKLGLIRSGPRRQANACQDTDVAFFTKPAPQPAPVPEPPVASVTQPEPVSAQPAATPEPASAPAAAPTPPPATPPIDVVADVVVPEVADFVAAAFAPADSAPVVLPATPAECASTTVAPALLPDTVALAGATTTNPTNSTNPNPVPTL